MRGPLCILLLNGVVVTVLGAKAFASTVCSPQSLGFRDVQSGDRLSPSHALKNCGAVVLRGVFDPETITATLEAFQGLPDTTIRKLKSEAGFLRGRTETHLPFTAPFSELDLFGLGGEVWQPVASALGRGFELVYLAVLSAPPGAGMQQPHLDFLEQGSVTVQVPLHTLDDDLAPVGICLGTHEQGGCQHRMVFDTAQTNADMLRFCDACRWKQIDMCVDPADTFGSLRTSTGHFGERAEDGGSRWKMGDEIVAINGLPFDNQPFLKEVHAMDAALSCPAELSRVSVVRERKAKRRKKKKAATDASLAVGADLSAGDALLYDSRTVHWGNVNRGNRTRFVLYMGFMSAAAFGGGDGWDRGLSDESLAARGAFRQRFKELNAKSAAKFAGRPEL